MSSGFSGLQPWLAPWASRLLEQVPGLLIVSTYRSYTDQLRLWRQRARNPYPVAPPGRSMHQYGRAFDLGGRDALLHRAGQIWEKWGGRWGGRIGDPVHFEA